MVGSYCELRCCGIYGVFLIIGFGWMGLVLCFMVIKCERFLWKRWFSKLVGKWLVSVWVSVI